MAIGVDPELRLSIGSAADCNPADRCSYAARLNRVQSRLMNYTPYEQQNKKQMTIFYNGRVCVYDATEMKARAIISMAKRQMDEMMKDEESVGSALHETPALSPQAIPQLLNQGLSMKLHETPALSPQAIPQLLNPGLSMKRSLHRFLQKRKARMSDISPYNQKHQLLSPNKYQLRS